jgi:hypothetical protein
MSEFEDLMELINKAQRRIIQCRFSQLRMSHPADRLIK